MDFFHLSVGGGIKPFSNEAPKMWESDDAYKRKSTGHMPVPSGHRWGWQHGRCVAVASSRSREAASWGDSAEQCSRRNSAIWAASSAGAVLSLARRNTARSGPEPSLIFRSS
eukprot:EG_transcript_21459